MTSIKWNKRIKTGENLYAALCLTHLFSNFLQQPLSFHVMYQTEFSHDHHCVLDLPNDNIIT